MRTSGVAKTGIVKTYDPGRGFGFIASADGREHYFHCTGIESDRPLKVGDVVRFIQGYGRDGRTRARNVTVLQSVGNRT